MNSIKNLVICILICCSLTLFNCVSKRKTEIEYYPNGIIKSSTELIDTLKDGRREEYYDNGKIKLITNWSNDTLNGESLIYTRGGQLKEKVNFVNGKLEGSFTNYFPSTGNIRMKGFNRNNSLVGKVIQYFDRDSSKVMAEIDYINYHGEQKQMGDIWYDSLGNVVLENRRVILKSDSDTIKLGDNFELLIELRKPSFDSTMIVIGDYDGEFNIIDKSKFDTVVANNHKVTISKVTTNKGESFIRGYAKNWEIEINEESTIRNEKFPVYFEYRYFVE